MDTTKTITHISLCAGYGGIDLGLARAIPNLRTILFSEIEAFACANLVAKMEAGLLDAAPIWTDLKTLPWDEFRGKVDILSGGFPCQPFSCAGKRDGDEDPRHLFPYILDGIGRCRPSIVFLENVEGILSAKLSGDNWRDQAGTPVLLHVLRELERVGYKATAGIFSASEVGAPHQRKRVFIMAHRECAANKDRTNANRICELSRGSEIWSETIGRSNLWPSRPGQPQYEWEPPRVISNSIGKRPHIATNEQFLEKEGSSQFQIEQSRDSENLVNPAHTSGREPSRISEKESQYCSNGENGREYKSSKQIEPSVGGNPNGTPGGLGYAELSEPDHAAGEGESELWRDKLDDSRGTEQHRISNEQWKEDPASWESGYSDLYISCDNRTDELRLLGNGVVPATSELAFKTLAKKLGIIQ